MKSALISALIILLVSLTFASCFPEVAGELESLEASEHTTQVRILTRADGGEALTYPLHVYAFSDEGKTLATQTISAPDEPLQLTLPKAEACHLVALSAADDSYSLPSEIRPTSVITMLPPTVVPEGTPSDLVKGYTTGSPLQLGSADILPQGDKATVSIQLHYQVASLHVSLQGFPASCTSVYLSVASPYTGITLSGQGSGSQTTRIPLTCVSDVSSSGKTFATEAPVCLFPTSGNTTFTIAYNDADGEQYSSVSYLAPLSAGTPYQLQGTYSDNTFQISGSISPSTWTDPVVLSFTFNPSSSATIQGEGTSSGSDTGSTTDALPQPLTIYNGHLVVGYLDADGTPIANQSSFIANSLIVLSLTDWGSLPSSLNPTAPTAVTDIAQSYSEFDLTDGWRIPTEAEARYLSKLYRDDPDTFDQALTQASADPIVLTDNKGNNLRYLCSDAQKTYSYKTSTVTNAGATVKTYHLRLVRTIIVNH